MLARKRRREIVEYILKNYPNSCIAYNSKGKEIDDLILPDPQDEDAGDFVNMGDLMSFFYHELINFCGCGKPELIQLLFIKYLKAVNSPYWTRQAAFSRLRDEDEEKCYLMMYTLDRCGFTEHGSDVFGSILTDLGKMVLDVFVGYFEWCDEANLIPPDPEHCPVDDVSNKDHPILNEMEQFAAYQEWLSKRHTRKEKNNEHDAT